MSLRPVLNYDILLEVLKLCGWPGDCVRFMQTGRFFYTHGFEALLSHSISIPTQKVLLCFLTCLKKDAGQRFKYVRSVRFGFFDLTEPAGLELANALRRMSNLETLSISYSEDMILSHPDLVDAFAALSSVRKLDLGCVGETAIKMLQSLRSELISVDVNFLGVAPDGEGFFESVAVEDVPLYHPAVILEHSRSSLQELSSYGWEMDTGDADLHPAPVYPQMHQLELERSGYPYTIRYIDAYPNLTHLRFITGENELGHYYPSSIEDYDIRHALNVAKQLDLGRTWASLRDFSGSLVDLYMLGLTCTIDNVDLHGLHDMLHYMLQPVLSYARPRQLTLDDWPADLRSTSPADVFATLRGQVSSRLEMLCVEARLDKDHDDGTVDIVAVFDGLRSSLLNAPLQELQMKIWMHDLDPRPDDDTDFARMQRRRKRLPTPPPPDPAEFPLCFAERSAEDFDLEGYVRRFMDEVPTLQRAHIVLGGPRDRWRLATIVDGKLQTEDRR